MYVFLSGGSWYGAEKSHEVNMILKEKDGIDDHGHHIIVHVAQAVDFIRRLPKGNPNAFMYCEKVFIQYFTKAPTGQIGEWKTREVEIRDNTDWRVIDDEIYADYE